MIVFGPPAWRVQVRFSCIPTSTETASEFEQPEFSISPSDVYAWVTRDYRTVSPVHGLRLLDFRQEFTRGFDIQKLKRVGSPVNGSNQSAATATEA